MAAFAVLSSRGHKFPDDDTLINYRKFRAWWDEYQADPDAWEDPYKAGRYNFGFTKRTK